MGQSPVDLCVMKEGQTETILTTCFRFRNVVHKTIIKWITRGRAGRIY